MQPTVIPFDLTFGWFIITMLIMMFAIFAIQWLMKNWTLWQSTSFWKEVKKVIEHHQVGLDMNEGAEHEPEALAESGRYRGGIDLNRGGIELESLAPTNHTSRDNVSPV